MRTANATAILVGAGLIIGSQLGTARADAIDGNWCSDDGRHLSIAGPAIVTPAGTRMTGSYSRHSFHYTVPAGETDSGQEVVMRLLNETTVRIQFGSGAAQIWHRCAPETS